LTEKKSDEANQLQIGQTKKRAGGSQLTAIDSPMKKRSWDERIGVLLPFAFIPVKFKTTYS